MKKLIMVTGGQRSGKSEFAEKLAFSFSASPVYVATSRIWDEDFRQRVEVHKQRRIAANWENIEEEKHLGSLCLEGRTVLVDCLTLWAANFFYDNGSDCVKSAAEMKEELGKLFSMDNTTIILVTNEIGLGGVSACETQRKFADLMGTINRFAAAAADEVYLSISGIPVKIK